MAPQTTETDDLPAPFAKLQAEEKTATLATTPQISVVMPVYNAAPYLAEAIESVLQQSLPDFELIVVDDGSTDGSPAVAKAYLRQDARVRYMRLPHCGINTRVRNEGLTETRGAYIAFLDADDRYLPDALERLYNQLQQQPQCPAVFAYGQVMDANGHLLKQQPGQPKQKPTLAQVFRGYCPDHLQGLMLRRQTLEGIGLLNPTLPAHGDYEFYLRLWRQYAETIAYLPEPVFAYRRHAGSLTRQPERLYQILEARRQVLLWLYQTTTEPDQQRHLPPFQERLTRTYCYAAQDRLQNGQPELARKALEAARQDAQIPAHYWWRWCFRLWLKSWYSPLHF
ncbi:MAG: glycosyltransferase [Candidatus Melainabacteria bacterium]|nr:glycosyltransferase [Candidatus Melainabacteria bacterium]